MSVEEAEKSRRIAGGIGDADLAEVEVAIVEGEGEMDALGGTLGRLETRAESIEISPQEKEERLEGIKRVFKFAGDLEMPRRAVEFEKSVMFAVDDVVEAGRSGTEALGESLARKSGKVAEGRDAPELEQLEIGAWRCVIGDLR